MSDPTQDLSKRGFLRLILSALERIERIVTAASDYMQAALDSLDVQLRDLQTRLQTDAEALRLAIENSSLADEERAELVAAADRVQATAVLVSGLAQPSVVADPEQPDVQADPIPPAEQTPDQAPGQDPAEPGVDGPFITPAAPDAPVEAPVETPAAGTTDGGDTIFQP